VQSPSLKQRLTDDLKKALLARDKVRVSAIKLAISAIKYAEIARQGDLTDGDIAGIISKEIKQRRESIDAFKLGKRDDLVAQEAAEMAVLQEYMPPQMTREEIAAFARQVIAEVGASGPKDKGKVMSKLMPQLKGRAEGQEINAIVSELLAS
jgi:uncharacterized protein YqeY